MNNPFKKLSFWTVDAFTSQPFSGNPAAVILVADFPLDSICQKLAAEMNLSETAFLKPLDQDHYHIRWFTPTVEVKLCGHATLASAHILFENEYTTGNRITLESLSGPLFVKKSGKNIILDFPLQKTGDAFSSLALEQTFKGIPILNAVKAYDDIIVELTDFDAIRSLQLDFTKVMEIECRGLIVTAKGNEPYDFISRFFAPRVGVLEDPVTGSAHCKLADYWHKKLGKSEFLAYQASSRGGIIELKIENDRVFLSGTAITMVNGEIRI